jgi:quinol monooxygenase YgiN
MKLKIIKELSMDKTCIFFNVYKDNEHLSSHVKVEDAKTALERAIKLMNIKPVLIKEVEI